MYSIGDRIHHDVFGFGLCEVVNDNAVTIRFDDNKVRKIGVNYPRMKVVTNDDTIQWLKNQIDFSDFLQKERNAESSKHHKHWNAITPHENLYNYLLTKIGADSYLFSAKDRIVRPLYNLPETNTEFRLYQNKNLMYYAMRNDPKDQFEVKSWYPFFTGRTWGELKINKVLPWHGSGEAQLLCTLENQVALAFHDTHYQINRASYGPEYIYTFFLTGLAYHCMVATENEINLQKGSQDVNQKIVADYPGFEIPNKISLKGMSLFLNYPDGDVDDYTFRGTVKKVTQTSFLDLPMHCFRTTLLKIPCETEDKEIDIDIYVSPSSLEGNVPKVGDDIEGVLWLQGYLFSVNIE